jgi:hypothetical protein
MGMRRFRVIWLLYGSSWIVIVILVIVNWKHSAEIEILKEEVSGLKSSRERMKRIKKLQDTVNAILLNELIRLNHEPNSRTGSSNPDGSK